jgi:hypothetical protein
MAIRWIERRFREDFAPRAAKYDAQLRIGCSPDWYCGPTSKSARH